jgi:hypothetical protein
MLAVIVVASSFGLWWLFRSLGRWQPQQGTDPEARQAELRVRMETRRTLEGGA